MNKQSYEYMCPRLPSPDLCDRIMTNIAHIRSAHARRRSYIYASSALVALAAAVPALQYAHEQAGYSGLYDYLSLFISDGIYAIGNLKVIMLSIAEALPMTGTALVLITLVIASYAADRARTSLKSYRASILSTLT